jgi:hypothetical protein
MPRILLSLAALVTFTLASQAMANDITPPSAPTNLTASGSEIGSGFGYAVVLTWSPSTDDSGVARYNIYYNRVMLMGSVTGTQATIYGMSSPCSAWTVTAEDAAYNDSPPSNVATVSRPICSVYDLATGVRHNYYPPDDVTELTRMGFPLQMWDTSGPNSDINSGWVCALLPLPPAGESASWACIYSDDFTAENSISTEENGHPMYLRAKKSNASGTWNAEWGTGGRGWSFIFSATYGL